LDRAVPIQGCHAEQTNPTAAVDVDVDVVESKINIKAGTSTLQIKTSATDGGLEYSTTTIVKEEHSELFAGELAPIQELSELASKIKESTTKISSRVIIKEESSELVAGELASDYLSATRAAAIIQEPSELASEIKISDTSATTAAAIASIACLEADIDDDPVTRDSQEPKLSNKADSRTKLVSEELLVAGKGLQQEPSEEHIIDEELTSNEDHHKIIDDFSTVKPEQPAEVLPASLTSDPPAGTIPFVERIENCSSDSVIVESLETTATNTFKVLSSSSTTYQCQADNNKTEDFKESSQSLSRKKEEDKHFNPDVE
jgi:hypothetical protein